MSTKKNSISSIRSSKNNEFYSFNNGNGNGNGNNNGKLSPHQKPSVRSNTMKKKNSFAPDKNTRTIIRGNVLMFEYISIKLYYFLLNQDKFDIDDNNKENIKTKFNSICKIILGIANEYMLIQDGRSDYKKISNQYMTKKNNKKNNNKKNNKNKISHEFSHFNMNIPEIKNKLIKIINNNKIFKNEDQITKEINLLKDENINKTNYIFIIDDYISMLKSILEASKINFFYDVRSINTWGSNHNRLSGYIV